MPQLPTFTVTDAQAARITAAFGDVASYKTWLKEQIIAYVISSERRVEEKAWSDAQVAKANEVNSEFRSIT